MCRGTAGEKPLGCGCSIVFWVTGLRAEQRGLVGALWAGRCRGKPLYFQKEVEAWEIPERELRQEAQSPANSIPVAN